MRSALFHREITGDKTHLKKMIDKRVEDNVRRDIFSAKRIDFDTDISRVGYNTFYTATLSSNTNILTLYDNITFEEIWNIKVTDLDNYRCDFRGLIVSDSGTVLYMAKVKGVMSYKPPHIQIFLDGNRTGAFFADGKCFASSTLTIKNNRVFGVSQSREDRQFYEWNITGELVQEIHMDKLLGCSGSKIDVSDEYFIVSTDDGRFTESTSTFPIFILNLKNNNIDAFDLFRYGFTKDHRVSSIQILNDELFISYHICKLIKEYTFDVPVDIGVLVLDIKTGEMLMNYSYAVTKSVIHHMKVNYSFIVFLSYRGLNTGDTIYAINRDTHELHKVTTISPCCYSQMNLHLTKSVLTVTFPRGSWNTGWAVTDRCVIDLNDCRELQKVEYKSYPDHPSFFGSGSYISVASCSNAKSIYVEKFTHFSNETTCDPKETLRTFKNHNQ